MAVHPIYRVRRRVLAQILIAGGEPRPDQWRRAALEPFDEYGTPWGDETDQRKQWGPSAGASPEGSALPEKAKSR